MRKRLLLIGLAAGIVMTAAVPSSAVIPGVGVIHKKNMEWVWNVPQAVGSDLEFFEQKQEDGSLKRYAVTGSMGNGFNVIDITDPTLPVLAGSFVTPGLSWQGDIQINAKRELVVLSIQSPGTNGEMGGQGIMIVDISDPTSPILRSTVNGLSAHNSTIISDTAIYVSDKTIVDYSDPDNPVNKGKWNAFCGIHDITLDPNNQDVAYFACPSRTIDIWDVSDPFSPVLLSRTTDNGIATAHESDPSPDSSLLFVTDERGGGLSNANAPGGGLHVYDISGKHSEPDADGPASLTNPIKVGFYIVPFHGLATSDTQAGPWGNVTSHVTTFQAERHLLSVAWYTMGSWVADLQYPTNHTGPYQEWSGNQFGNGPTTWGNTQGGIILEGDEVWSSKWTAFDDPVFDRYLFTNGLTRGMDVIRYTGSMPQKVARLAVDDAATDGAVTGVLDRYAVWTYEGWVNKPLAGKSVKVKVDGGPSATVTTGADGSFSADLGLGAGSHDVTVSWTDVSGVYQTASQTLTVTA